MRKHDFFDIKGVIEVLMERLGASFEVVPTTEPFLDRGRGADIMVDGAKIG